MSDGLLEIVASVVEVASRIATALKQKELKDVVGLFRQAWHDVQPRLAELSRLLKPLDVEANSDWQDITLQNTRVIDELWASVNDLGEEECFALDVLLVALNLRCGKPVIFPQSLERRGEALLVSISDAMDQKHGSLKDNAQASDQVYALSLLVSTHHACLVAKHSPEN